MNKKVNIQPYYIKDKRKSKEIEIEIIEKISKEIRNNPHIKCQLSDLITLNISDIPEYTEITNSYNKILKTDFFGIQHDWLSRFAKSIKDLEISINQGDNVFLIIKKYGDIKIVNNEIYGKYYILDKEKSSQDLINIFGNFRFPVITSRKLEMKKWAEDRGLSHIMHMTWFCHTPKNNYPCGTCSPCISTIEEGLAYRFNNRALLNYRVTKIKNSIKKLILYKDVKIIINKLKKQ